MILAGIDIGTNSLRLLVADVGPDSFRKITADRKTTRLGRDLDRTGRLSRDAEERSLEALQGFAEQIRRHAALRTAAVGTSALRNASNSSAFIREIKNKTAFDITVITGEEEARLTFLGVKRGLAGSDGQRDGEPLRAALVIDVGGGSTELISSGARGALVSESLPLGAVYLNERFIRHDPPLEEELVLLRRAIREELEKHAGMIRPGAAGICVGTAGTITTLAAIDQGLAEYDPDRINRFVLTLDALDAIIRRLSSCALEERRTIPGLEQGREDIILAGALIVQELMRKFSYASLVVSDGGLREGVVLDLYDRM